MSEAKERLETCLRETGRILEHPGRYTGNDIVDMAMRVVTNQWALMQAQLAILERLDQIEAKTDVILRRAECEYRASGAVVVEAPDLAPGGRRLKSPKSPLTPNPP